MAAQYDVNLEKCALLKCLCGAEARLLQDRLRCAHLLLKSPSFLVIQIKVAIREWEGMGVILPGVERDGIFPQFFRGIGTGRD